jgi:hypothetical protein
VAVQKTLETGDIVAQRVLELETDDGNTVDVTVTVRLPRQDGHGDDWVCPFEVVGLPGKRVVARMVLTPCRPLIWR